MYIATRHFGHAQARSGVRGLRVVDASMFPEIPGYFIVTPVFMIGEKAADVMLRDAAAYPARLESLEAQAIAQRRGKVSGMAAVAASAGNARSSAPSVFSLPIPVAVALSGGGIRSATFCLDVLQALARRRRLKDVHFPAKGSWVLALSPWSWLPLQGAKGGGVLHVSPMPLFGSILNDVDIADIIDYERSSWGNHANS